MYYMYLLESNRLKYHKVANCSLQRQSNFKVINNCLYHRLTLKIFTNNNGQNPGQKVKFKSYLSEATWNIKMSRPCKEQKMQKRH